MKTKEKIFEKEQEINEITLEINELNFDKGVLKEDIKILKRKELKEFRNKHKKIFLLFDIAVILVVLMNFGALAITNALVVKEDPNIEFVEVNPVVAERGGYVEHPDSNRKMTQFEITFIFWTLLIIFYVLFRNNIKNEFWLSFLSLYILLFSIAFGTDFINDFGYYVGVKLWG